MSTYYTGFSAAPNTRVTTTGSSGSQLTAGRKPGTFCAVYDFGTTTLADIDLPSGTSRVNPFPVNADGSFAFYGAQTTYDLLFTLSPAVADESADEPDTTPVSDFLNIRDYGAIGDGSTDDTLAIQAALDAAGLIGGGVFIPAGTFRTTAPLTLSSYVEVLGLGPVSIISATASSALLASAKTGFSLRDFAITGTVTRGVSLSTCTHFVIDGLTQSGATVAPVSGVTAGIAINDCTDGLIQHGTHSGNGLGSVNANASLDIILRAITTGCSRIHIVHNRCTSTLVTMHIGVEDSSNCTVRDNDVTGALTHTGAVLWGYGIYTYSVTLPTTDNQIVNNRVTSVQGTGIYIQQSPRTLVQGNDLYDVCSVQLPTSLAVGGIALNNVSPDCLIADNRIRSCVQPAIRTDAPRTLITGNSITTVLNGVLLGYLASSTTISNNQMLTASSSGIGMVALALALTDVIITGNLFNGMPYACALDAITGVTIADNDCLSTSLDGIVTSNCAAVDVHGNRFRSGTGTSAVRLAGVAAASIRDNHIGGTLTYGITMDSSSSLVVIDANDLSAGSTAAIGAFAPRTVVKGNTINGGPGDGVRLGTLSNGVTVQGNSIRSCVGNGIGGSQAVLGITNLTIQNNVVRLCAQNIAFDAVSDVVCNNNVSEQAQYDGILFSSPTTNNRLTCLGNVATDNNQLLNVSANCGIRITGFDRVIVAHNRCSNVLGTSQQTGISMNSCTHVTYSDNDTNNNAVAGTSFVACTGNLAAQFAMTDQVLATGAAHTVDDVITQLQTLGLVKQS